MTIPAGFSRHTRRSPAAAAWEPLYARATADAVHLGFEVGDNHCNGRGTLHGGVIAALCDNAMGLSLGVKLRATMGDVLRGLVTTGLSVDYLGAGQVGQWIEISPRVVWSGASSGVVDALVTADAVVIARANATFRIQRDRT
jgi:acyl-coenzyme A thioesterase PaaI-like protein